MPRPAKPIAFHIAENKAHLTKAEIETRQQNEIKIGETRLTAPEFILQDKVAIKKWRELKKIYEANLEFDLVSSGDIGHIARYCQTFSEYLNLVEHRRVLMDNLSSVVFQGEEEETIQQEFEDHLGNRAATCMWKKVEYLLSMNAVLDVDRSLNQKSASLLAMEDRLFLNPLSKIKVIPKTKSGKTKQKPVDKTAEFNL
jgi:phage terminase small subunit